MTLDEAVKDYLIFRRSEGSQGAGAEAILRTLCRQVGRQELKDIHANQVSAFINDPKTLSVTRLSKFSVVRCFFDHYAVRNTSHLCPWRDHREQLSLVSLSSIREAKFALFSTQHKDAKCGRKVSMEQPFE